MSISPYSLSPRDEILQPLQMSNPVMNKESQIKQEGNDGESPLVNGHPSYVTTPLSGSSPSYNLQNQLTSNDSSLPKIPQNLPSSSFVQSTNFCQNLNNEMTSSILTNVSKAPNLKSLQDVGVNFKSDNSSEFSNRDYLSRPKLPVASTMQSLNKSEAYLPKKLLTRPPGYSPIVMPPGSDVITGTNSDHINMNNLQPSKNSPSHQKTIPPAKFIQNLQFPSSSPSITGTSTTHLTEKPSNGASIVSEIASNDNSTKLSSLFTAPIYSTSSLASTTSSLDHSVAVSSSTRETTPLAPSLVAVSHNLEYNSSPENIQPSQRLATGSSYKHSVSEVQSSTVSLTRSLISNNSSLQSLSNTSGAENVSGPASMESPMIQGSSLGISMSPVIRPPSLSSQPRMDISHMSMIGHSSASVVGSTPTSMVRPHSPSIMGPSPTSMVRPHSPSIMGPSPISMVRHPSSSTDEAHSKSMKEPKTSVMSPSMTIPPGSSMIESSKPKSSMNVPHTLSMTGPIVSSMLELPTSTPLMMRSSSSIMSGPPTSMAGSSSFTINKPNTGTSSIMGPTAPLMAGHTTSAMARFPTSSMAGLPASSLMGPQPYSMMDPPTSTIMGTPISSITRPPVSPLIKLNASSLSKSTTSSLTSSALPMPGPSATSNAGPPRSSMNKPHAPTMAGPPNLLMNKPHASSLTNPTTFSINSPHAVSMEDSHASSIHKPHAPSMIGPPTSAMVGPPTSSMIGHHTSSMVGPPASSMMRPPTSTMMGLPTSAMMGPPTSSMMGPPTSTMVGAPTASMMRQSTSTMVGPLASSMMRQPTSTVVGPPASSMVGPPASSMVGPPTSSMVGPPTSSMVGPPASTMVGPPASSMVGPPTSSMMRQPTSTLVGPPTSSMMRPPTSSMVGPPVTSMLGPPVSSLSGPTVSSLSRPPISSVIGSSSIGGGPNIPVMPSSLKRAMNPPPRGIITSSAPPIPHGTPLASSYKSSIGSNSTNAASNRYAGVQSPQPSISQMSQQLGGLSVTKDGWNKGWGTNTYDLFQQKVVIPPLGVVAPRPVLQQEFLPNCSPDIFRCTISKIPESQSVLQKSRLPFGVLIHPFKDLEHLAVVSCNTIVRCRSCRTYINPFVLFKGERKWECNLCYRVNELPDEFQFDPLTRTYGDPSRRPEVREATIEFIAPQEYMLRPPQPATYVWVLDVSRQAVETGYLKIVCDSLLSHLDNIPGDRRTLMGFITFSTTVQFYLMGEGQNSVQILEVGEIDNIFIPSPEDLLVHLDDSRHLIEELLTSLPEAYADTIHTQTALGAAVTAAYKLISHIGGRITMMAVTLPTIGPGSLKTREDPNQRSAKDIGNLGPATDFYKKLALDCSAQQIAVDLFTLNSHYIDLATLSGMSKFSGGCIHHFPMFNTTLNSASVEHFKLCLDRYITRKIGFEAVMRIRATRGLSITNFHGNFFVRSTDLLSLPNINPDAGFGMQVNIEEPLHNIRQASFQAALLYTSSRGERRIRVHTLCLPVSANVHEIIGAGDQQAIADLLGKMAVDKCISSQMSDAREAIVNACADIFSSYKASLTCSTVGFPSPSTLQILPLYLLGLLKSVALRHGISTKLDDRVYAMCELKMLPLRQILSTTYPDLYPIHDLSERGAFNIEDTVVPQPGRLHLSAEYIDRNGAYLMDAGATIYVYVRSGISSDWVNDALGVPSYAAIPQPLYEDPFPTLDNSTSDLIRNFICHLQKNKSYAAPVYVIKEDNPARCLFIQNLVDDRSEGAHSYVEFLQFVKSLIK